MISDYTPAPCPVIKLPAAGGSYVDPVFGSTVYRVTDEKMGTRCVHYYAWGQVWNADETRMLLFCDWYPWVFSFADGVAKPLFSLSTIAGIPKLNSMSAQWDRVNPAILYVLEATPSNATRQQRLLVVDVANKTVHVLRDFAAELAGDDLTELDMADSGLAMSFQGIGPDGVVQAFVWDRTADKVLRFPGKLPTPIHSVTMSRDGQWVQVAGSFDANQKNADIAYWRWCDGKVNVIPQADRGDTGIGEHCYLGRGWLAAGMASDNAVGVRRWETFGEVRRILPMRPTNDGAWKMAHHISLRAIGGVEESSVIVSTYGGDGLALTNEIAEVGIDGSWFRRLAHTRSFGKGGAPGASPLPPSAYAGDADYWRQPRASVSRSGRWAVWTADLGQADRTDVMVVRLPTVPGNSPSGPTGPTQAEYDALGNKVVQLANDNAALKAASIVLEARIAAAKKALE